MINLIDIFLNLDKNLALIIQQYGFLTYFILFAIIFLETGIVFTPFLPGDSLLFVAGTLAASGYFNVILLFALVAIASILGDTVNYFIGKYIGEKIAKSRYINKKYLDKTHSFYEKYGGKTIIIARFIPIIRTFAPFVAGIGKMRYSHFLAFNLIGGILWTALFIFAGYFFGNIPIIKDNLSIVIIIIILLSIVPVIIEIIKARKSSKK